MKESFVLYSLIAAATLFGINIHAAPGGKGKGGDGMTGNGGPSGSHYQLNIIGVPKGKNADNSNNGRRIFVPIDKRSKIMLKEGSSFQVLDHNGTDGRAEFQLPNPYNDGGGAVYEIFARPLGKPGGSATVTTCATDPDTGEEICSLENYVAVRSKGKSSFTNVTKELTTLEVDIDGDGDLDTVNLFDDAYEDYFWSYDNNGLKLLQLRFYPVQ